eukprot:CAMPEP_0196577174 /NCGR_PEP_ID=MMETSP1081-20130531/6283_1 /TAXON_ID=36882 /ORGANISM="Pyramimonas amylifera, Strain CCMP720" /LENGTH=53 /DNA_ID=CAMNT_0041896019 /DNA_START=732 /DNA_END=893 /DNA_ORIENTATION=-
MRKKTVQKVYNKGEGDGRERWKKAKDAGRLVEDRPSEGEREGEDGVEEVRGSG